MTTATRVLTRYVLSAKKEFSSKYLPAMNAFREGDTTLIEQLADLALGTLFPNGGMQPAAWFHSLGSRRRSSLDTMQKTLRGFQRELPDLQGLDAEDSRWKRAYLDLSDILNGLHVLDTITTQSDKRAPVQVGGFNVIEAPGVSRSQAKGALESLQQAAALLRGKFPQVVYGDVYLATTLQKGIAAWYIPSEDKFYLNVKAKKSFGDVHTILHELGHRYENKFLKDPAKKLFWDLSMRTVYKTLNFDKDLRDKVAVEVLNAVREARQGSAMPKLSDDAMAWLEIVPDVKSLTRGYMTGSLSEKDFVQRLSGTKDVQVETREVLHGPLAVTPYGGTKPAENFAEGFAHYVMGMDLPPELYAVLDDLAR